MSRRNRIKRQRRTTINTAANPEKAVDELANAAALNQDILERAFQQHGDDVFSMLFEQMSDLSKRWLLDTLSHPVVGNAEMLECARKLFPSTETFEDIIQRTGGTPVLTRLQESDLRRAIEQDNPEPVLRVWYVEPFGEMVGPAGFVQPAAGGDVTIIPGNSLDEIRRFVLKFGRDSSVHLEETWGVAGIASTDPHWDGKPTFRCGHCDIEHDVHENVALVLYKRLQKGQGSKRTQ